MCVSARLFLCARCRKQVVLCSHCDRGNRYCGSACARRARREAQRAAARRYQSSHRGRRTHAARQARYRRRQREKVTHQGSPAAAQRQCSAQDTPRPAPSAVAALSMPMRCQRCGRSCSPYLRQGFLARRPRPEAAGRDP